MWDMVFGRMNEFDVDELVDAVEEKEGASEAVPMDEEAASAADAADALHALQVAPSRDQTPTPVPLYQSVSVVWPTSVLRCMLAFA